MSWLPDMLSFHIERSTVNADEGADAWINVQTRFYGGPLDGGIEKLHYANCDGTRPALLIPAAFDAMYRLRSFCTRQGRLVSATYGIMAPGRDHYPDPHRHEVL